MKLNQSMAAARDDDDEPRFWTGPASQRGPDDPTHMSFNDLVALVKSNSKLSRGENYALGEACKDGATVARLRAAAEIPPPSQSTHLLGRSRNDASCSEACKYRIGFAAFMVGLPILILILIASTGGGGACSSSVCGAATSSDACSNVDCNWVCPDPLPWSCKTCSESGPAQCQPDRGCFWDGGECILQGD